MPAHQTFPDAATLARHLQALKSTRDQRVAARKSTRPRRIAFTKSQRADSIPAKARYW